MAALFPRVLFPFNRSLLSNPSLTTPASYRPLHLLSSIFSTPLDPLFSKKSVDLLRNVHHKENIDKLNELTSGFLIFAIF